MASLPTSMRALVQTAPGQASVQVVPVPKIEFGTVLIKVEAVLVHSNFLAIFNASLPHFRLPYPIIPGMNAVGRVAAAGPDATVLSEGKLVITNTFIRGRDDPSNQVLWGITPGATPEENHLYDRMARHGVCAEYALAPLENTYAVDEARLLGDPLAAGGLGLQVPDLLQLAADTILYSGLRTINLQAGERIIITPATGHFSAAAVEVAVAMGGVVIAASRSAAGLAALKRIHPGITTVQLAGDLETDSRALAAFGPVDAVMDVSPPAAAGSNNLAAAISALKRYGRVSLMGGRLDQVLPIPYMDAVMKQLTIHSQYMFPREHQRAAIKLAESGLLKLGEKGGHGVAAAYGLGGLDEAMAKAVELSGPGKFVILEPWKT
ncbi:alcohol dehydrogenase [Xylariales sp. PMI_506]|nr:alcohol dehydrogenase [Xylariales sp. PMI_506]